tara:strand:+ start:368 stop:802 length:435 start_codon:yes stop_codon:yes gene_type:complete
MKQILLFIALISLYSCCPKISETIRETHDTVTVVKTDTIVTPPITFTDTINFSSFCDSIAKGLVVNRVVHVSKGTITIKADSTGKGQIICETDSLRQVITSLQTTISNLIEKTDIIEEPLYKNVFFWLFVGLVIVTSYFAFRKR